MSKKIYVGNLPWSVDHGKLKELFSSYGEIEEATVISDKYSGRSKGFGFVTFINDAEADKAVAEMNDKEIEGRPLKVNEAKPREDAPADRGSRDDQPSASAEANPEEIETPKEN